MSRLFAGEWLKLRKRWMPRILLFILLAIAVLIFWGVGASSARSTIFFPRNLLLAFVYASILMSFLAPVLAGSWAGNEYGWGTIRTVLSRRPDRIQFALAGVVTVMIGVVIALLVLAVVSSLEVVIVALVTGHSGADTAGLPSGFALAAVKCFLATVYVSAFYVVLSYTFGTVFRSGAAGIGVGIGFTVAQTIVSGIFFALGGVWRTVSDHLPGAYTGLPGVIADEVTTTNLGRQSSVRASMTESVLGIGIYVLVPLVLTLILIRNRDVTS